MSWVRLPGSGGLQPHQLRRQRRHLAQPLVGSLQVLAQQRQLPLGRLAADDLHRRKTAAASIHKRHETMLNIKNLARAAHHTLRQPHQPSANQRRSLGTTTTAQTRLARPAPLRLLADVFQVAARHAGRGCRHRQQLCIAQVPRILPQDVGPVWSDRHTGLACVPRGQRNAEKHNTGATKEAIHSLSCPTCLLHLSCRRQPQPPPHLHASFGRPKLTEVEKREMRAGSKSCRHG